MRKIPVKNLKEGYTFSEPVYIDSNNILVPAGVEIREKDILRVKSWGIDHVETEGDLVSTGTKKKGTTATYGPLSENAAAYQIYFKMIENMNEFCNNISLGLPVEASYINEISSRLLKSIREQREHIVSFILGSEIKGKEMAKSLVNTAILSALTAMELKLPHHRVLHVITGALLHDVGMLKLPKTIVEKRGGLSAAELKHIQSHTLHTYKIVSREMRFPAEVGVIVIQHHERWDGEGYPRGISGNTIDIGARIVSVADAFEAMVSQKPYRNPMIGYQAMKNLLSDNLRRFDPNVIKAFITTMGIYPIGSIVLLNNGTLARVVEVRASSPLRPKMKLLMDEAGQIVDKGSEPVIDLLNDKSLFITRAVDPGEIKKKNAGKPI